MLNEINFKIIVLMFCSSPIGSSRLHENHLLPLQHIHQSPRLRKDERDLDVDEENWFNDDGDENKISSLNHGTLFHSGSDDEDSQPEITGNSSAISTNEPIRSHHLLLDNEEDGSTEIASSKNPAGCLLIIKKENS
jgi:hypothetical protein